MESVTKEAIQELLVKNEFRLYATHPRLCVPIINRIYKKMVAGIKFFDIKVENDLICDGHHRYVASLIANFPLGQMLGKSTSATSLIDWHLVFFDENDWDTQAKIDILNKEDAEYNDMPLEKIVKLLE